MRGLNGTILAVCGCLAVSACSPTSHAPASPGQHPVLSIPEPAPEPAPDPGPPPEAPPPELIESTPPAPPAPEPTAYNPPPAPPLAVSPPLAAPVTAAGGLGGVFGFLFGGLASSDNEPEDAGSGPSAAPEDILQDVKASRAFASSRDGFRNEAAGFGIIAFARQPWGTLEKTATHVCNGFMASVDTVDVVRERAGAALGRQVVTVWPVIGADTATALNDPAMDRSAKCAAAIQYYDRPEADIAIAEAIRFYEARDKPNVVAQLESEAGPWLLAWAPGAKKGDASDDVLVLAFNLSYIDSAAEAEEAFQAWRVAIERNPDLWKEERIANESWNSAIVRMANMLGRADFLTAILKKRG